MKTYIRTALGTALVGLTALSACDQFLKVDNPNSLVSDAIDPARDATLLSQSVYQKYVSSLEDFFVYGAWFTNHARVGDTFPTRNEFGRRQIPSTNTHISTFWNNLHSNLQFARSTIKSTAAAGNTVDLVRDWFVSGESILLEANYFCEGTIAENTTTPRGKMTISELLDSAIVDLKTVQTIAAAITPASTEATNLSTAAQVGIAQALLQKGDKAGASAAAAAVPAAFTYSLAHIDNSTQRSLGNQIWSWSESRISLVTGPEFRARADAGDPRIKYVDAGRLSQDGVLQFYRQNKFTGWGSSMRLASGLEAQYIKEEADQNPVTMIPFINVRRTAGGMAAYAGPVDLVSLTTELLTQKSYDFWLEGKDVPDFRRNPTIYPFVLQPGPNYYKPSLGPVASDVCWPVADAELRNNPKWVR